MNAKPAKSNQGKQHLHRYAAEFDFRYNNRVANGVDDAERGARALTGAVHQTRKPEVLTTLPAFLTLTNGIRANERSIPMWQAVLRS